MNVTELKMQIAQRCRLVSGEDMDGNKINDKPMIEFNEISEIITGRQIEEYTRIKEKCIEMAKENWSKDQAYMLEKLFEAVETGTEYKCIGCEYFGRASDAPEIVPKDCMWQPSEFEDYRPCEDD